MNPKLRFKGFSGEWDENIVSSIFKVTRGRVLSKDLLTNKNQNSYPVYSSQTSNKGLLGWFNTYLFENAITWTTDGMNAGDVNFRIGKFYCTNVCGVLLSDEYCNLAMSLIINKFCKKFVSTQLGNPKLMNNTMSTIKIIFPKIDECEKIAKFFTLIDKQIDLLVHKLQLLEVKKKYYLNNLFCSNDSLNPKLRFKGFSGEWEESKLSNIIDYERPDKFIVKSTEYSIDNSLVPVLTANKGFILGYSNEGDFYNKGECIIFDDFTMDFKYVSFNFKVKSSAIKILTSKNDFNLKFIHSLWLKQKFIPLGHNRHYISIVQEMKFMFPSLDEQTKIAKFFTLLDKQIKNNKNKEIKLLRIKSYYLNNIFI